MVGVWQYCARSSMSPHKYVGALGHSQQMLVQVRAWVVSILTILFSAYLDMAVAATIVHLPLRHVVGFVWWTSDFRVVLHLPSNS